jgi:catechol 2,3-dioxygenase-like lactoylglutathione lyase family enzyme
VPARLDHVTFVARDVDLTAAFHDRVLAAAGLDRVVAFQDFEDEDEVGEEAVGYGTEDGGVLLWLVAGRTPTAGAHVALRVDDAAVVDAVARAAGATAQHRDLDRPGYYGVVTRDPDGNTVEVYTV